MTTLPFRRTVLALTVTAAVAVTAAACGTENPSPPNSNAAAATPNSKGSVSADGAEITTINHGKIKVPGGKPTALFFFSVGCGECAEGAKSLATAGEALSGRAGVLAVDMDPSESPQLIRQFLDDIKAPELPAVIDAGATLSRAYKVAALSTLIVVDPAGTVTFRATDPGPDQIQAALEAAGAK